MSKGTLFKKENREMEEKKLTGYPSIDKPWLKYYDKEFLAQPIPEMNIYSYLRIMTQDYGHLTALSYFGKEIFYKEFWDHIDEAAKVLTSVGVKSDDRVMYLMPNIPETAYFLYGGARIGAVADYIDPRPDSVDFTVSARKVLSMFKDEKAKFLVSLDQCYLAMLKPIEQELKELGVEQIILVSASDSMDGKTKLNYLHETLSFNGYSALLKFLAKTKRISKMVDDARNSSLLRLLNYADLVKTATSVSLPDIEYQKDQLAVIVHTSGTSSAKSKPIPLTHDNFNFYAHQTIGANMPMAIGDRVLHMLPFFAAFGICDVVHAGFCHANNLIMVPEFATSNFGKLIKKYKPQTIIGAPSWFLALSADVTLQGTDLLFLTMATYGGDSIDAEDEIRINHFLKNHNSKCVLTKGHGMSETCGCASYATGDYNILASVGIPMPLTTYAVVEPETKEMLQFDSDQDYLEGELIISSGVVTLGILDGNVIVPHKEYNGENYIFTRDIARMDRNGVMTFLSRSDRSITRFDGYKIKPYEVENIIKGYPDVQYCIISPVYDSKKFGNVTIADIVLQDNNISRREEQVKLVEKLIQMQFINNANVSARQIPVWFRFREKMPLTANSKVDYNALAKEPLTGTEVFVQIEETNISVNRITVI